MRGSIDRDAALRCHSDTAPHVRMYAGHMYTGKRNPKKGKERILLGSLNNLQLLANCLRLGSAVYSRLVMKHKQWLARYELVFSEIGARSFFGLPGGQSPSGRPVRPLDTRGNR